MKPETARSLLLALALTLMLVACGGTTSPGAGEGAGGDTTGTPDTGTGVNTGNPAPGTNRIDLIASSTNLDSAAVQAGEDNEGVELTAIVRDDDNAAVSEPDVSFSASAGRVVPGAGDAAAGTASATLFNDPDRANREIEVTASVGDASDSITISATGTRINLSGPGALARGARADFTAALSDSAGNAIPGVPVEIVSKAGNTVAADTMDSNASGQVNFALTGDNAGTDTITVRAFANADAKAVRDSASVAVGGARLMFVDVDAESPTTVGQDQPLRVQFNNDGNDVAGKTVRFTTSRGTLDPPSATTGNSGEAATALSSQTSGPADITASIDVKDDGGKTQTVQARSSVLFRAGAASTLVLKPSATTLPPNGESRLTAVVRDALGNPIDNARVNFRLAGSSSGALSTGQAATQADGGAQATYTAGASSVAEPVEITATLANDEAIADSAALKIAGEALSIKLGTGGPAKLRPDATTYDAPYAVIVTDAAGNPAPDASLQLSIEPQAYRDGSGPANFVRSEDRNNNGILDDGEDANNNCELDPGRVVTVPGGPALDETGVAQFNVTYLSRYADRVRVELGATAAVAGSEGSDSLVFVLDGEPSGNNPFAGDCDDNN